MGFFVRAVAILVGLANIFSLIVLLNASSRRGGDPAELLEVARLSILPSLHLATVAGLLVAEVLLRLMRPALEGKFLYRYGVIVLGVCLGGVLAGALMGLLVGFFGPLHLSLSLGDRVGRALAVAFGGTMVGGGLGLGEGLILAFPLAAILGRFRGSGSCSRTMAT